MPTAMNPHREDPAEGFLATANDRTVGKDHPVRMSSSWYSPERVERNRQVLSPMKKATVEDMTSLQYDHYSLMVKKTQAILFRGESAKKIRSA
ncbi:MAG: hypothetical protein E4G96_06815, partial [Chrysiogenales bacterium]